VVLAAEVERTVVVVVGIGGEGSGDGVGGRRRFLLGRRVGR